MGVKFRHPCLNRSREIPREAVGGGISDVFNAISSERKPARDVISGEVVQWVSPDGHEKFEDSMSEHYPDIQAAHFVMDGGGRTLW